MGTAFVTQRVEDRGGGSGFLVRPTIAISKNRENTGILGDPQECFPSGVFKE